MEELMKETKAGQTVPTSETEPKKKFGLPKSKKAKKWMKIAIAAVVIAAVAAGCMARASKRQTPISAAAIWWLRPPGRI